MDRCFTSSLSRKIFLHIILFSLPIVESAKVKEDISISYDALRYNSDLDSPVEDGQVMADGSSDASTQAFVKDEYLGATFLNEGLAALDELSDCIRARQEKSTLERWMECLNSLDSHSMASQDVLPSSTREIPSTEEENGIEFSNLQQEGEKVKEEPSDSLDASLSLGGMQHFSAEFKVLADSPLAEESTNEGSEEKENRPEIIERHIMESDDPVATNESASVTNSNDVDPELPSLEESQPDVSHTGSLESGDRERLGKLHQGYNIAVCLLKNGKRVALYISSLLLLLKVLSIGYLKKMRIILPLLTEAKQRAMMKIITFFDFKDSERAEKLLNEQGTTECVASSQNDQLMQALGCHLGIAVATVLAEVLENKHQKEQDILADELSKLMRLAIKEELFPVLDGSCNQFAKDFEASFRSTFKTIRLVKRVYYDKERTPCQSSGEHISNPRWLGTDSALNGLATDACGFDTEIECTEASSYEELHIPSIERKHQVKSDKRVYIEQHSCSPDTACEWMMKVGVQNPQIGIEQEACSKSRIVKSDPHADLKFSEATTNCLHEALREKWQSAGHDSLISGMTGVDNVQSNSSSYVNFIEVNTHAGNCHTDHLNTDSGVGDSEIEGRNRNGEDARLQAAQYPNITMSNSSFVSTGGPATTAETVGENGASDIRRNIHCGKETLNMPKPYHGQRVVLHGHAQPGKRSERETIQGMGSRPEAAALAMLLDRSSLPDPESHQVFLSVLDKFVREQERCNELKSIELMQKMKHFKLEEENLHVNSESNKLMRQRLDFNVSRASFKERVFTDQKLHNACMELSKMCADELVAGLLLMLLALAYGVWRFSYARLSEAIASCQPSSKPSKSSWFNNPINSAMRSVTGLFRILQCEVAVVFHMLLGVLAIATITCSLLRPRVMSSSQAMSMTIILIVLGGFCGWAGKFSVDTLGGSGFHWLVFWEVLCILHAFANCFTSYLFFILNEPTSCFVKVNLISSWIRKLAFHTTLLFVLPVMAGLTPFASVRDWTKHFSNIFKDNVPEPVSVSLGDGLGYSP